MELEKSRRLVRPGSFMAEQLALAEQITREITEPIARDILWKMGSVSV